MADNPDAGVTEDPADKKSKMPMIIGLVLALAFGGGGFYATHSGLILKQDTAASAETKEAAPEEEVADLPEMAFVELPPIIINIGSATDKRHLKFLAQLEIHPKHQSEVQTLIPRVTDVLNGYLRAVSLDELEDSRSLIRLRAQMLRRAQVVTGQGRIRDLLIMEFIIT